MAVSLAVKEAAGFMQSDKDAPNRISNLADDVICRILSLLTMKEAAATSLLSRRWKYLWVASLTRLVFDEDAFPPTMKPDAFEKIVNGVVHRFPKGVTVEEFCVRFCPDALSTSSINNWLAFAFSVGIARVELDLFKNIYFSNGYSIPIELFHVSNNGNRFTSLSELSLININVGDQLFKAILSTCASLECLVMVDDDKLCNAKCIVPLLKLKRLTLECRFLKSLEITAPNLVSFRYHAFTRASISIEGAPPLVSLDISSASECTGDFVFRQFSSYTSQLQCLTLDTIIVPVRRILIGVYKIPSFQNLRTLSLMHHRRKSYRLEAIYLLEASPLLQRFELHLRHHSRDRHMLDMNLMSQHQNLKEIMLSGFTGKKYQICLLMFIVGHTVQLESVEVTTSFFYNATEEGSFRQIFCENKNIRNYEELFEKLGSMLPPKVSLRLLP